jgi:16S rRNA (adenine1518-N6/adenine1519-N6)-dimethyltransferase
VCGPPIVVTTGGPPGFDPAALPPLREVIARHRLRARKSLGQHFLLDRNLTARIARAAGELSGVAVIEIGPGPGGLTRALLATEAREVVAVERDRRCVAALAELAEAACGRLRVVEADARSLDALSLVAPPRAIVANLPYNVATVLLIQWLEIVTVAPQALRAMTLMFQKEVAVRLAAAPGTRAYGRLSVLAQWLCSVRPLFDVPARAFTPPPKVTSSVVRLVPRCRPLAPAQADTLQRVTAAAFGRRRKMIRASLTTLAADPAPLIAAAGVAGTARAEQLSIEQFCALARALAGGGAAPGSDRGDR